MDATVSSLDAMFERAEANVDELTARLNNEFSNLDSNKDCTASGDLLASLEAIKKDFKSVVQEAEDIRKAQQDAVVQFKEEMNVALEQLQRLQMQVGDQEKVSLEHNGAIDVQTKGDTGADNVSNNSQSIPDFVPISEVEFQAIEDSFRRLVRLRDVNQCYHTIWTHFKDNKINQLTLAEMSQMGMRVTGKTGEAKLLVLNALKKIQLEDGHISLKL